MTRRLAALIAAALALLLVAWVIRVRITTLRAVGPSPADIVTTRPTVPSASPSPSPSPPPVAQRLAGIVVGSRRYAVVEQPDGTSELYQLGEQIPGLGRLVAVEPSVATFEGRDGLIRLVIAPAPTVAATATSPVPIWTPPTTAPTLRRSPVSGRTSGRSSP